MTVAKNQHLTATSTTLCKSQILTKIKKNISHVTFLYQVAQNWTLEKQNQNKVH